MMESKRVLFVAKKCVLRKELPLQSYSGDEMESLSILLLGRGLDSYGFYNSFTHSNMANMFHLADSPY